MDLSHIVAAVKSDDFDSEDITSIESMPLCRVCHNDKHETSQYQWMKNTSSSIRTGYKNFSYLPNRQTEANSIQILQHQQYQQGRIHPGERSSYNRNLPFNRDLRLWSEQEKALTVAVPARADVQGLRQTTKTTETADTLPILARNHQPNGTPLTQLPWS